MLSDRLWSVKVVGALFALLLLCRHGEQLVSEQHPSLESAALDPPVFAGRQVILLAKRVTAREEHAFVFSSGVGPFRVSTPDPPEVGAYVTALATIRGPRELATDSVQVNEHYVWKRTLTYSVSIGTLLACAWAWRRRFRLAGQPGAFVAVTGPPDARG